MADSSPLWQPTPRRRFELTPTSTEPSTPPTPTRQKTEPSYLDPEMSEARRTRSILNLTSSTLFGIFSPGDESVRGFPSTPGAVTPAKLPNPDGRTSPVMKAVPDSKVREFPHHSSSRDSTQPLVLRLALLFCSGMAYGLIVRHLHDRQQVAPVKIDRIDRNSWTYLILWGGGGVILGSLMPLVDRFWEQALGENEESDAALQSAETPIAPVSASDEDGNSSLGSRDELGWDWETVVRGIGAFIGIAFAIRRLPWQSTLQVSLTMAFLNPVLWYLIDRSKPGFCLSSFIGIIGTAVVLGSVSFDHPIPEGLISNESIGAWTWMASVLFCSTLCFGNIGRKLALGHAENRANIL